MKQTTSAVVAPGGVPAKENKTTALNRNVFPYILAAIDGSGYGKTFETETEKLQFVVDTFYSEYGWPNNLKLYGSYQNMFANWLMGLPSSINIDFENYRIIELAKEWKSIPVNATEKQEDKILSNWFNFIANKFVVMCNRHKVRFIFADKLK